jgi:type IV pilus assembly protein PilV
MAKQLSPLTRASGFTLLEVLIAVLVLAIGLLGMASLQVAGLRNNQSAYYRSQATQLAYDMADRMRANPVGLNNGNYNNQAPTNENCVTSTCSAAQMAGYDLAEWTAELTAQLPSGAGVVCIDGTPNDGTAAAPACDNAGAVYAIKVWWDDDRSGAANQRFVTSFRP